MASVWRGTSALLLSALVACTGVDDSASPSPSTSTSTTATSVETTTTVAVAPTMRIACETAGIDADLDGDGATDRVAVLWVDDGGVLAACLADGSVITRPGGVELLWIVDVDADGRDEIVNGGTTACAAIGSLVVLAGRALRTVEPASGGWFELRDGCLQPETGPAGGAGWGCEDGLVVRVTTTPEVGGRSTWMRTVWRIDGTVAHLVAATSGTSTSSRRYDFAPPDDVAPSPCPFMRNEPGHGDVE